MQYEQLSSVLGDIIPDANDPQKEIYRIGDLASEFDVTLRTLRFYEDRGLLSPERSGSTRLYSAKDRSRLRIILLAKRVGFSLIEIQEVMDISYNALPKSQQISELTAKFKNQLSVLKVQRIELDESQRELEHVIQSMAEIID